MNMTNPRRDTFISVLLVSLFFSLILSVSRTEQKSIMSFLGNLIVWFPLFTAGASFLSAIGGVVALINEIFTDTREHRKTYRDVATTGMWLGLTSGYVFLANIGMILPALIGITRGSWYVSILYVIALPILIAYLHRLLLILLLHITRMPKHFRDFWATGALSAALLMQVPVLALIDTFSWSIFIPSVLSVLFFVLYLWLFVTKKSVSPKRMP